MSRKSPHVTAAQTPYYKSHVLVTLQRREEIYVT